MSSALQVLRIEKSARNSGRAVEPVGRWFIFTGCAGATRLRLRHVERRPRHAPRRSATLVWMDCPGTEKKPLVKLCGVSDSAEGGTQAVATCSRASAPPHRTLLSQSGRAERCVCDSATSVCGAPRAQFGGVGEAPGRWPPARCPLPTVTVHNSHENSLSDHRTSGGTLAAIHLSPVLS
ncbi:uncharacterized protein LOC106716303 isoform X2 [Papilio machaon]|uniref:uncharacterized protein LOC106716303 isoform X2 n=1 Tax=Papilio machaon TaxID=76193 RepID=UPI001E662D5E|nr:uncharacterized protein LOC106716303 isoform X2 [Papilio machaon]